MPLQEIKNSIFKAELKEAAVVPNTYYYAISSEGDGHIANVRNSKVIFHHLSAIPLDKLNSFVILCAQCRKQLTAPTP